MTSFQTGTAGQGGGILAAPKPELPDGRGPNSDIVPVSAIPVGGPLQLLLDTTVPVNRQNGDQVAIDITRAQPPGVPTPADYTRLPRLTLPNMGQRPVKFPFPVPTEHLGEDAAPDGPTTIWVRGVYFERGFNSLTSDFVAYRIDRTAPWQAKPIQTAPNPGQRPGKKDIPKVSFANAAPVLDDNWANAPGNSTGLRVLIDTIYPNAQPDDRLRLYQAGQRTNPPQVPPFFDGPMPANGEVIIPLVELRKITTGRLFVWFMIIDAAGNESAWGVIFNDTRFLPLPALGPLRVPANDDGLIELNDARATVTAEIDRPVNALNDDEVSVAWGSQPAQDLPFGALNKLVFNIPWLDLITEYSDNQSGDVYEVPVLVRADLMRANVSVSNVDTTVNTDFSTHPPYIPDPLDPPPAVNPEFKPAIVRGQAPVTDNVLGPHDANQTATLYVDVSPVTAGTTFPDPEAGDLVTAKYRGDAGEVVVGSVPMDDQNINTIIDMPLPYSIVGPGGLGTKQVWWEYENPNRNNTQLSIETDVTVNTVVINLDKPEFVRPPTDGTSDPNAICDSHFLVGTERVLRFLVPPNAHYALDMDITFNLRGWHDAAYTIPSPGTSDFTETRKITAPELIAGMIFEVPYQPNIRDLPRPPAATPDPAEFYAGYMKIWNSTPTVPTSAVLEMVLYLLNGDFKYCDTEPGWIPAP